MLDPSLLAIDSEHIVTEKYVTLMVDDTIVDQPKIERHQTNRSMLCLAIDAAKQGKKSHAIQLLRLAAKEQKDNPEVWFWLASLSSSPLEQMLYFKKVLHLEPFHEKAIGGLKLCYFQCGCQDIEAKRYTEAKMYLHELLNLDPRHVDALLKLARIAETTEQRIQYLSRVIQIDPKNKEAMHDLLQVHMTAATAADEVQNHLLCQQHLDAIFLLDPCYIDAHVLKLNKAGRIEEALPHLREILKHQDLKPKVQQYLTRWSDKLVNCHICQQVNVAQDHYCSRCRAVLSVNNLLRIWNQSGIDQDLLNLAVERHRQNAMKQAQPKDYFNYGIVLLFAHKLDSAINVFQSAMERWPILTEFHPYYNKLVALKNTKTQQVQVSQPSVLVIDDSPSVQKVIDHALRKSGYLPHAASSSSEAFKLLKSGVQPQLIILDAKLPKVDGFHVLKLLRNTVATRDVPVIMLTKHQGFLNKMRAHMTGVNAYLTKPISTEDLLEHVRRLCPHT